MKIKSDMSGLNKLAENAEQMHGTNEVKITDIMTSKFIKSCSQFESLEKMFDASGFEIKNKEDFSAIPEQEWEDFIVKNTTFSSWIEMQKQAIIAYTREQLFKGI